MVNTCDNCDKKFPAAAKFCPHCGAKVEISEIKETKEVETSEVGSSPLEIEPLNESRTINVPMRILVLVLLIGGIITAVVVGSVYFDNNGSTGAVTADSSGSESTLRPRGQTCRNVQVPYTETESYSESVPYTDEECENKQLVYRKTRGQCKDWVDNYFYSDEPATFDCTLTNLDTEGGLFSMKIGFMVGGQELTEVQNKYLYPQSSETFRVTRNAKIDSCYCAEQSIPTKQVCRDVTRYRDVPRTREVTKYRTEQQCN